jgi:hypothetical protein
LLALAVFVRSVVALAVAVLLGGAALAAMTRRQWVRLGGLCAGFTPVLTMPLHNWYFGHRLVLFSDNASGHNLHVMPADYAGAMVELAHLNFAGPHAHAVMVQLRDWPIGFIGQREIGGLLGYLLSVPVHLAAVAVAIYVAACGRHFDRWLRLTAGAALAQHVVAFFYGRRDALFLSHLVPHHAGGGGLVRAGGRALDRPALAAAGKASARARRS